MRRTRTRGTRVAAGRGGESLRARRGAARRPWADAIAGGGASTGAAWSAWVTRPVSSPGALQQTVGAARLVMRAPASAGVPGASCRCGAAHAVEEGAGSDRAPTPPVAVSPWAAPGGHHAAQADAITGEPASTSTTVAATSRGASVTIAV